jgi:hypothetical protein
VTAGHLTEAEFWASKQAAVKAIQARSGGGQKAGLSTQLLSLLSAPKDTTTGRPQLSLTPAMEQQIFAENPAVAAVYAKTVPHVRSREKFYEQYIDMLRNRVDRRRKRAAGVCLPGCPYCSIADKSSHWVSEFRCAVVGIGSPLFLLGPRQLHTFNCCGTYTGHV